MTDTREIIAKSLQGIIDPQPDEYVGMVYRKFSDDILSALAEAGYVVTKWASKEDYDGFTEDARLFGSGYSILVDGEQHRLLPEYIAIDRRAMIRAAQEKTNG